MTLTLILMRHAKAAPGGGGPDHDRPLTGRGRQGSARVGRWLAAEGIVPDEALVSTAARTRATWEGVLAAAGWTLDVTPTPRLYDAPASAVRAAVAEARGRTVLVVGHNPSMGRTAATLARAAPDHERFGDYPTAATTVLRFDAADWGAAMRGTGEVVAFAVPADL